MNPKPNANRMRSVAALGSVTARAELIEQVIADQGAVLQILRSARPLPEWAGLSLTVAQLTALFVLYRRGSLPIGELGALLGLGKPAATLLVNALVGQGLVERREDPRDRRRTLAELSSRAHLLLSEHYAGSRQQFADWLAQLDPADLASLAGGLHALASLAASGGAQAAS
jgi:DNA-binding MarR family transcriptional regulator